METGSYLFDGFTQSHKELERLKQQARQIEPFETHLLRSAGLKAGMKVLDAGCGPGVVSSLMARLVGKDGQVLGVDASEELLAAARTLADAEGLGNLTFEKGDIYDMELGNSSFDFIYSRLVFQHLTHPLKALEGLMHVLKPGGILCISDIDDKWLSLSPEPESFQSLVNRSVEFQAQQGGDRMIGHKLGSWLTRSGFTDLDVQVMPVTSKMMGMRQFLQIGMSFRIFAAADDEARNLARSEFESICELAEIPEAWGFLAVFVATGKKPGLE